MKRSLSPANKLCFVWLAVLFLGAAPISSAQQPAGSKPVAGKSTATHTQLKKTHRKPKKKHKEIRHGSDNDKALENIKAEKNKRK